MSSTQQGKQAPPRNAPKTDQSVQPGPQSDDDQWEESAEEVRQGSQTAQDRDHTIRRGDAVTRQTKEFPT